MSSLLVFRAIQTKTTGDIIFALTKNEQTEKP